MRRLLIACLLVVGLLATPGYADLTMLLNAGFDNPVLNPLTGNPLEPNSMGAYDDIPSWIAAGTYYPGDSSDDSWLVQNQKFTGGLGMGQYTSPYQIVRARFKDSVASPSVGSELFLFQSIGTVGVGDYDQPYTVKADYTSRRSVPADTYDYNVTGSVFFATGVTGGQGGSIGTLLGTVSSLTLDNPGNFVNLGNATYTPTPGDLGKEVFVVLRSTVNNLPVSGTNVNTYFDTVWLGDGSSTPPPPPPPPTTALEIESQTNIHGPVYTPLGPGDERSQMSMVKHPDGSIYLNTQHGPLMKSTDDGENWTQIAVNLPDAPSGQALNGLGVSSDGRLWLTHQTYDVGWTDLFISNSADGGATWTTSEIDYANLAPTLPDGSRPHGETTPYPPLYGDLYDISANDYNTFIEQPDGSMMVTAGGRYTKGSNGYWDRYQLADTRLPGIRDLIIRSTTPDQNGDRSWDDPDPTILHQHVNETSLAVDPNDPNHILAMTRIQRQLMADEGQADFDAIRAQTGCPDDLGAWVYKNGILLESWDGGLTFDEVAGSLTDYYGTRGTILWTDNDIVIVTHQDYSNSDLLVRISLNGGETWVADSSFETFTDSMNESERFLLADVHSFTAPTVALGPLQFLTTYYTTGVGVQSVVWSIPISEVPLPGDFDLDGDVDGVDFGLWQSGYPTATGASLSDGDFDGDGDVDGVDFGIWQANYPTNLGSAATIPEPATLFVMAAAGLGLLLRQRRSRS